ncbi:hypothetical protein KY333_05100 [Candidatus Woesearchaeota archaeon]|nr:hypothetical protein [Candidatus Woesearchaeota archaeon]
MVLELWQGVILINIFQFVMTFISGIFVIQLITYLFRVKNIRWTTAIKISGIVNLVMLILLSLPYFFQNMYVRIFIIILTYVVALILFGHLVVKWYHRVSWRKGLLIGFIFLLTLFVLGFPLGFLTGYIAYFLNLGLMPI